MQGEAADRCVASSTIGGCTVANRTPPPPLGHSVTVITWAPRHSRQFPTAAVVITGEPPSRARAKRPPRLGMQSQFINTVPRHPAASFGHDVNPHPDIMPRRALAACTPVPPGSPGEFVIINAGIRGFMHVRPLTSTSLTPGSGDQEGESHVKVRQQAMRPELRPHAVRLPQRRWRTRRPRRRRWRRRQRPWRRPWPSST